MLLSRSLKECSRESCIVQASYCSDYSSLSSGKVDFQSQPLAVVLLAVDRVNERGGRLSLIRLIHNPIVGTKNSSMLKVAHQRRCVGISHLYARPFEL